MSQFKPTLLEEDIRSCEEGKGEGVEEGYYSYHHRDEDASSAHLNWSNFEELDDSGHFTASPDGERTVSESSRCHSPCPTSAHLLLQMQHQQENKSFSCPFQQPLMLTKPLISPRSIMTVKVPPNNNVGILTQENVSSKCLQTSFDACASEDIGYDDGVQQQCDDLDSESSSQSPSPSSQKETTNTYGGDHLSASLMCNRGGAKAADDESSEYLRSILENFNSLYMEKLRLIDDLVTEGDSEQKKVLMEKKTNMLENWAKDVCVQNMVLVHTVEELEREATRKVSALQQKITESTQVAKEHMSMIKKYEQQVKLLLKNHSDTEEKNLVLKIELEKLKSECRRVRDRMNLLLKDNESLITLVCRIRDMGVWDVSGLELQRSSFDQIFGLYPRLVGSEVQTVFTKEKAQHVKDTEEKIKQLEKELGDLHKTHREAESNILQKDRKLEELETEIKNVSNKAKYCEQECNDYKKSLLETQERLLEATRKLNSTPKNSRPNTPAVNEMAQLIRELREVKSQLNTAVEEKQTAKEESSYFKKELSERLKEMHDIQNVFQSLATEVVSSRSAFQQVQEKEVQLQDLKSEVQSYQSRCANAEDTIRKKEQEIKQLQKQMNSIHKKSKKQSYLSSTSRSNDGTEITSNKPNSTMLGFYNSNLRNVASPSRIPVRKATMPAIRTFKDKHSVDKESSEQGSYNRPPWNTHFKKSFGLMSIPAAGLPEVKKSPFSKDPTTSKGKIMTKSNTSYELRPSRYWKRSAKTDDNITEQHQSSDQISFSNRMSEYTDNFSSTAISASQVQPAKLPKVDKKVEVQKKSPPSPTDSGLNGEALPPVKKVEPSKPNPTPLRPNPAPSKPNPTKGPPKKLDNPILKNLINNPPNHTPRLNELITAVVETSKQLLGDVGNGESTATQRGLNGFTVTAAHYRKTRKGSERKQEVARKVRSSEQTAELNRIRSVVEKITAKIPKKQQSATVIKSKNPEVNKTLEASKPLKVIYEAPQDVTEFLSGLPQESQEDIVKGWIEKSASQTSTNKPKKLKLPLSGRKPSFKVGRHLATKRYSKPSTARSKPSVERMQTIASEMFELEDEWGKVFANLDHHDLTAVDDRTELKKVEKASGQTTQKDLESESQTVDSGIMVEDATVQTNSGGNITQRNGDSQEEELMEDLIKRLTAEKRELEERHQKELRDKDIEIKMQKVTIQHLQDAYVALKRGQPIPVPQNVTGNKIVLNGSSNGHPSNVLDV